MIPLISSTYSIFSQSFYNSYIAYSPIDPAKNQSEDGFSGPTERQRFAGTGSTDYRYIYIYIDMYGDNTPIMENHMEKKMEKEMETDVIYLKPDNM